MKTTTTNFLTPKDIFVLFLFVGLFSCPGFSQLGNYQVLEHEIRPESLRNPNTGAVLVFLTGPGRSGFAEVLGNGDVRYLDQMPQLPRSGVVNGDTIWDVLKLFKLENGFGFQGTAMVKDGPKTLYVSSVTRLFDWDYTEVKRLQPGHSYPINSAWVVYNSEPDIYFLGYEWQWVDSSYVKNTNQLFRFKYNYETEALSKDSIFPQFEEWDFEYSFMGGKQIGNKVFNYADIFNQNIWNPERRWIAEVDDNSIRPFEFPFQIFYRDLSSNFGGITTVLENSQGERQLLYSGYLPLRSGDYLNVDQDSSHGVYFYYLSNEFEVTHHFLLKDIDYGVHFAPMMHDNPGPSEGFMRDTIEMFFGVNVTIDIEGTVSQNTGDILSVGFLFLKALKSSGQVIERRYISRKDATGENYNPDYLNHITHSYFFNTNKDSVTVDLKTTIDIDKYESAFLTIALDDMSLSTPKGLTKNQLRIYPNPTTDFLRFEAQQPGTYSIIDAQGRSLSEGEYSGVQEIDVRNLSPGSYQIVVQEQSKKLGSYPFLKR